MRNNIGRFVGGWRGIKKCSSCSRDFQATSGSQKKCTDCLKCKECSQKIKGSYVDFCGISCAAKWKYRNNPKIQENILKGRELAFTPEVQEKSKAAQRGKPRPNSRGDKNPNWKGGTYGTERHKIMGRIEYINWRKAVFERDDYTCQACKIRGGPLNADHIIPWHGELYVFRVIKKQKHGAIKYITI